MHYIAFPDYGNVLSCVVSLGHFCRLELLLLKDY